MQPLSLALPAGVWLPLASASAPGSRRRGPGPALVRCGGCWCSALAIPRTSWTSGHSSGCPSPAVWWNLSLASPIQAHRDGRSPVEWEGEQKEGRPCSQVLGPRPSSLGYGLCRTWGACLARTAGWQDGWWPSQAAGMLSLGLKLRRTGTVSLLKPASVVKTPGRPGTWGAF